MPIGTSYEPSVWMRETIAARLRLAEPALQAMTDYPVVLIPLSDPPEHATEAERAAWETQCDRCGAQCRGKNFHTGAVTVKPSGREITFTFGLCEDCQKLEKAIA